MSKRFIPKLSYTGIVNAITNRPLIILFVAFCITALAAWQIPRLVFQTSVYDLRIEDLPETAQYEQFKAIFGSDEIIRVVIRADNIFDPGTFAKIEELADQAARIDGVRRVISLPGIKKAVDRSDRWGIEKFAEMASDVPLFKNNLLSSDRKTTVLTLVLDTTADPQLIIRSVEKMIAAAPAVLSLYQIGMPLVSQALAEFAKQDFMRLPPLTFLLIAITLLALLRKGTYLFLPLGSVVIVLIWTFGLMSATGVPLSMLTMIVPVFLIAVGTAYCLHIISDYQSEHHTVHTAAEAVQRTFSHLAFPTGLAVLTTLIGLGSLLLNRITAIREFALFACFGMLCLLVILLLVLPAAMVLLPRSSKKSKRPARIRFTQRITDAIVRLNLNHQRTVFFLASVLVVFCLIGVFRIRVETNPVGYFKEDTPVRRNFHQIARNLSGSFPLNVVMDAAQAEFFENPANVADMVRLQGFLDTLSGVDKSISFADYLMLVNYVMNRFKPEYYRLPAERFEMRMLINQFKTVLGEDLMDRFVDAQFSKANILMLTHLSSSRDFLKTRDRILAYVTDNFSRDLRWEVTGFGIVISASSDELTAGQIKSLSLTMVLVFGIMFTLFLSAKVGLIAILPNLFPIVINFGLMGWLGIELSMATSLIASIAIGLAVDDTIHYLFRYNREFKKDLNERRALKETLRKVGRPIIFTTVTISIGFCVLGFSSFKPTAIFGVMMMITVVSALIGDLILLPALMLHVELVTLWDLVRLKMGREPSYGIPLFQGLSHTQVHYILMAGSIKSIPSGEVMFRKGDPSDSMYAIISGAMDVIDPIPSDDTDLADGMHKLINRLNKGDIFGEMGLLRSARRSATVIAAEETELLQINRKMIKRLQWLYPPTAQNFFFNLMTILCDRLENVTHCLAAESLRDDATGLLNRRGFLTLLENEISRAQRYDTPLCLSLIAVINSGSASTEAYGTGDDTIAAVSRYCQSLIRKSDTLGRVDSYTLALLTPHTSLSQARLLGDRLRTFAQDGHPEAAPQLMLHQEMWHPGRHRSSAGFLTAAEQRLRCERIAD